MDSYRLDTEHSWRELRGIAVEIMDALYIYSPVRRSALWDYLPEHLALSELKFLREYIRMVQLERPRDASDADLRAFRDLLIELPALKRLRTPIRDLPVVRILCMGLIAAPLVNRYYGKIPVSPDEFHELLANAVEQFDSCRLLDFTDGPLTKDELSLIRGELIEYIVLLGTKDPMKPIARSLDPEFHAWLGRHEDEVLNIYPALKERGSAAPDLVRELVGAASKPLTGGIL